MLISKKYKFIFIANPKTATTAISKFLRAYDSEIVANKFEEHDVKIKFNEHEFPSSIKNKLQAKYADYQKFVFIRHPYDKVVSAYFFLKNGKPLTKGNVFQYTDSVRNFLVALLIYFNVLTAKILPFKIWSIIRPVKKNTLYLMDKQGKFIVNNIGLTERLDEDLKTIMQNLNFDVSDFTGVSKVNTSSHKSKDDYFKPGFHKRLFDRIYAREIQLYEVVEKNGSSYNFEGLYVKDVLS